MCMCELVCPRIHKSENIIKQIKRAKRSLLYMNRKVIYQWYYYKETQAQFELASSFFPSEISI